MRRHVARLGGGRLVEKIDGRPMIAAPGRDDTEILRDGRMSGRSGQGGAVGRFRLCHTAGLVMRCGIRDEFLEFDLCQCRAPFGIMR
jgi:hypothetical protein